MSQRIVIDLYDHTPQDEVADILAELARIGIDNARYENDEQISFDAHRESQAH